MGRNIRGKEMRVHGRKERGGGKEDEGWVQKEGRVRRMDKGKDKEREVKGKEREGGRRIKKERGAGRKVGKDKSYGTMRHVRSGKNTRDTRGYGQL